MKLDLREFVYNESLEEVVILYKTMCRLKEPCELSKQYLKDHLCKLMPIGIIHYSDWKWIYERYEQRWADKIRLKPWVDMFNAIDGATLDVHDRELHIRFKGKYLPNALELPLKEIFIDQDLSLYFHFENAWEFLTHVGEGKYKPKEGYQHAKELASQWGIELELVHE